MSKSLQEVEEKVDNFVRDVTQVLPKTKSEVRRRLSNLISLAVEEERKRISEEVRNTWEERKNTKCHHPEEACCDNCLYLTFFSMEEVLSIINPNNL